MYKILFLAILQLAYAFPSNAQHDHDHDHRYERMDILHTKAIKKDLGKIVEGNFSEDSLYRDILQFITVERGIPVRDIFKNAGLDTTKHLDIYKLYKEKTGKEFVADPGLTPWLDKLAEIRSREKYAAQTYSQQSDVVREVLQSIPEGILQKTLLSTTMVFMESAAFWDYELNFYPGLAPKTDNPVRRCTWDAHNFSRAYQAMRELGLCHEDAHIVATVETAWQAAKCKNCGVW